jgi:hypothetical protein
MLNKCGNIGVARVHLGEEGPDELDKTDRDEIQLYETKRNGKNDSDTAERTEWGRLVN